MAVKIDGEYRFEGDAKNGYRITRRGKHVGAAERSKYGGWDIRKCTGNRSEIVRRGAKNMVRDAVRAL